MKRTGKRILSWLLSIVMVMSMFPATVFAAEGYDYHPDDDTGIVIQKGSVAEPSGTCPEGTHWTGPEKSEGHTCGKDYEHQHTDACYTTPNALACNHWIESTLLGHPDTCTVANMDDPCTRMFCFSSHKTVDGTKYHVKFECQHTHVQECYTLGCDYALREEHTHAEPNCYSYTWTLEWNEYTVTFDYAGGVDSEGKDSSSYPVLHGADVPIIDAPTKEGYFFAGWDTVPEGIVTGNMTYTALWSEECVVEFEGYDSYTVEKGSDISAPDVPTQSGKLFQYWTVNGTPVDFPYTVNDSVSFVAVWENNRNDIYGDTNVDGSEADPYTYYVWKDGSSVVKETDWLTGEPVPAEPSIDTDDDEKILIGWTESYDQETRTYTYIANWEADTNNNGVEDMDETVVVTIVGNGFVNGNAESFSAVYDSTKETTISLNVVPAIENGCSKSYVSSVVADDAELALEYVDCCVDLDAPVAGNNIVVTFTDCGFVYDEDGEMRFYVGMEAPDYESLYNAVIVSPEYSAENVKSVKYLARPAGTYEFTIPVLYETTLLGIYPIKIGGSTESVDLDDAWLDVGEEFKTLTADELQQLYNVEIESIKAKIAEIDLSDLSWSNAADKLAQFTSIGKELTALINTIKTEAAYLGYHQFGASGNTNENGNTQEILQVVYDDGIMHLDNENVVVTLVDNRTDAVIVGGNLSFEYDEFTDADIMAALSLTDKDGNVIEGELTKYIDLAGSKVGEYTYSVHYEGCWDYKPCTTEFTLRVVKAPSSMDVPNINISYGESYNADPVITNKHGEVIDIESFRFLVGLDIAELDVDGDGVKGLNGQVQLMIPKSLQNIMDMIGLKDGVTMSLNDLVDVLNRSGALLEQWGLTQEMIDIINQVLESVNEVVEAGDMQIIVGGAYPTNIGAYLQVAVSTDGNYETSYDLGYIIIKPNAERVYLDWNYTDDNNVYTWELLQHIDFEAAAYNDEELTVMNETVSEYVHELFFGIDENGEVVVKLDEIKNGTDAGTGAFVELAFVAEFGNTIYYAVPIVRPVLIIPNAVEVEILGVNENGMILEQFDNTEKRVEVELKYDGTALTLDERNLTVNYAGIQTNTKTYNSNEAPKHAGAYLVTATYIEKNAEGYLVAVGVDMATLVIGPSESTIDVAEKRVDADQVYNLEETLITVDSVNSDVTPDTTVISANIAFNGNSGEIDWETIETSANVDFPKWLDQFLAERAPDVMASGITVGQLVQKLNERVGYYADELIEMGATEEIGNSFTDLVNNITKVLAELPEDITLTFADDVMVSTAGTYAVIGIVTDSDHIPAFDIGLLHIHGYEAVVTEPTCTEGGYTTYTCSVCGDFYVADEVGSLGHAYGDWTYDDEENHKRVCANDETHEELDAHSYEAVVTEPTCTEGGYTTYTCSVCGDSYIADEVESLGHAYGDWTYDDEENHKRVCTNDETHEEFGAHEFGDDLICDSCHYDATILVDGLSLNKGTTTLEVGGAETLVVTVTPSNATCQTVTWTSSNPDVATVDENGRVTAVAVGEATITASIDAGPNGILTVNCVVTVEGTDGSDDSGNSGSGSGSGSGGGAGGSDEEGTEFVNPFIDVFESDYWYKAVMWAVENGITSGTTPNTFSPNMGCTRAHAVTFLWKAAGAPAPKSTVMPFVDVAADAYYYNAVLWAIENGITAGTSDTTFSPDMICTRAHIVTFLWRDNGAKTVAGQNPFVDVAADAYYADPVLWAVKNSITAGTSANTFSPDADCTRGQIVTFLWKCFE